MAFGVRVIAGGGGFVAFLAAAGGEAGGEEEEAEAATERARRREGEVGVVVEEDERAPLANSKAPAAAMTPTLRLAAGGLATAWNLAEARAGPQSGCLRVKEREARIDCAWKGTRVEGTEITLRRMGLED